MLSLLAKGVSSHVLKGQLREQKRLSYRLTLKDKPKGWINAFMIADMTKTWRATGLKCGGLNYFTLGDIKNGVSTRFQKDDPMYQAWLGGYIVECDNDKPWNVNDYCKLPEADQNKWLWHFGDETAAMHFGTPKFEKDIENNGFKGKLYSWTGSTHSDVGDKSTRLYTRGLMDGMAAIMNKIQPGLYLRGKNFVPRLSNGQQSYEETEIKGYFGIFEIAPKLKVVLYVCDSTTVGGLMSRLEGFIANNIVIEGQE